MNWIGSICMIDRESTAQLWINIFSLLLPQCLSTTIVFGGDDVCSVV